MLPICFRSMAAPLGCVFIAKCILQASAIVSFFAISGLLQIMNIYMNKQETKTGWAVTAAAVVHGTKPVHQNQMCFCSVPVLPFRSYSGLTFTFYWSEGTIVTFGSKSLLTRIPRMLANIAGSVTILWFRNVLQQGFLRSAHSSA